MTPQIPFKIGDVTLLLRWSRTARIRMSKDDMGLGDLMKPAKSEAAMWSYLAACNEAPATKDLTSEQLVAMCPEFETDEEEVEFAKDVAAVVVKVMKASQARGKKPAAKRKSGHSRGAA